MFCGADLAAATRLECFPTVFVFFFMMCGQRGGFLYPGLDDDSVSPACMRLCIVSTNLFPALGYDDPTEDHSSSTLGYYRYFHSMVVGNLMNCSLSFIFWLSTLDPTVWSRQPPS